MRNLNRARTKTVLLMTIIIFTVPAAWAIDCSKKDNALTARTMCSDPALVTQDAYLADLYSDIQKRLNGSEFGKQLRVSEVAWIQERNYKCQADRECISAELYDRANKLYEWGAPLYTKQVALRGDEIYRNAVRYSGKVFAKIDERHSSTGSAIKIWPEYFITNNHVVEGSKDIRIEYLGKTYSSTIFRVNSRLDLAILYVKGVPSDKIPSVPLYTARPGQTVYALGNPQGFSYSISNGIVSAIRPSPDGAGFMVIQNTAPISPGSSGGALLNEYGQVIGITTSSYVGKGANMTQQLNFAIPVEQVRTLLQ